jgi:hypothetical protein
MKSSGIVFAVLTLFLGMSISFADGHLKASTTDTEAVYWFSPPFDEAGGLSHLTRTDGMILITLEAANLVPGDVHTLWVIVFNKPDGCSAPGCGEDDIFAPDGNLNMDGLAAAQIAIGNGSGNVAKSDGTLEFGARLPRDMPIGNHQIRFGAGPIFGGGYLLTAEPKNAEVHLIIQSHGQARGGPKLLETLNLEGSNCTPFCSDVQFSVHLP